MLVNIVPTAVSDDPNLRHEPSLDRSTARIDLMHSAQIYAQIDLFSSARRNASSRSEEERLPPILSDNNVLNRIDPPPDRD